MDQVCSGKSLTNCVITYYSTQGPEILLIENGAKIRYILELSFLNSLITLLMLTLDILFYYDFSSYYISLPCHL